MNSQPSIQDVARLAGVSLGTVSNVLNNPSRVKKSTADKVMSAVQRLGYVRNDAARQLKQGKSSALGLVVLDAANPFFADIALAAEQYADKHGYQLLLGNSRQDIQREFRYLKMFQEQRLSGVLLSPVEKINGLADNFRNMGMQVVVVDQKVDASSACSVSVDDIAGGAMAAEHLLSIGRKRIAFVGGPLEIHQVNDRLVGAKSVIDRDPGATLIVLPAAAQDVISGREIGGQIVKMAKEERPDAIFAANDLLAVGVLQALAMNANISVPDDIALIGYDDIDFAKAAIVPLTSIKQPAKDLGKKGLELLLDEMENSDHQHEEITFQPELVIRKSTSG